ncbi:GH32 C-terminal domain-containing protein [Arthrobacter sp. 92]|uniref:glycoside hydrolase family 32 protein n=1 Tax=Arthrobacter sp. 92 TaxID=3418175 RepID=UPI003D027397
MNHGMQIAPGGTLTNTDPSFPLLHPRPVRGWLNDPNGLAYRDGRYHIFFQYNPDSARHNAITWGHMSSADLLHWDEEPVALRPQADGPDAFGCWSGVLTDDDGVPTAVYSGVLDRSSGRSQVTLARGSADLRTWKQEGETAASMPDDSKVTAVRDPFIFKYDGQRYAIQGAGLADGCGALLLYKVDNLAEWDYQGIWLTSEHPVAADVAQANIWECPQIVEVDGRWLLIVSLWKLVNGIHKLSGVSHMIGRMDDDHGRPVFVPETAGTTDGGTEFYAPQVLALQDRALLWGWSWEARSQEASDSAGWAGLLTFPRELGIKNNNLSVTPARELLDHRRQELPTAVRTSLPPVAEAAVQPHGEVTVRLDLVSPNGRRTIHSSVTNNGLRLFLDASIVEIFKEDSVATTLRVYPGPDERWELEVNGVATVEAWELGL